MSQADKVTSLQAEIERLRAEARQLRQEHERESAMLNDLAHLGREISLWDGTPEALPSLASKICGSFGYKAVAFSFFQGGELRRQVISPPEASFAASLSPEDVERVIQENQPTLISGAEQDVGIVPLVAGSQRVGVIEIALDSPPAAGWQDPWRVLSPQIASIIVGGGLVSQNVYLLEQAHRWTNELALINEISMAASSLDLNDVLRIVTQRIVDTLQVRRCAVFLLDDTGSQLVLRAARNPDLADANMSLTVPLAERPHISRAIETRQPAEVRDIFEDHELRSFWDKARELGIKAQLAVPLIAKQRVIGAISIDRSPSAPPFSEGDVELCQTIAHQAANAIENARLYEEVRRRAEQLWLVNRVSHDIGAVLDIDRLLQDVVRLILETLNCSHVAIALIEGEELVFRADIDHLQQPTSKTHLSLQGEGEGIAPWVARHGLPLTVPDVLQDPRYRALPGLPDIRSELALPLKTPKRAQMNEEPGERIIGVLDLRSTEVDAFTADDRALLEALAAQVAVAIESAQLFGRVREERATIRALIDGTVDAIIITDTADCILLFNPSARDAFLDGETLEPGGAFAQVVRNPALLDFWHSAPSGERYSSEISLPNGQTFYANLTPVAGVGKVAVMQDITYLKQMDEMKSEFVSTVSHDLRSPLQIIQTSAELLVRLGDLNQEQRREVEHILAVVRRISDLVQDLLDIGRIEAGVGMNVEPCALDEIIAGVTGACRALAESKNLSLTVKLPKMLPLVRGNRMRLDQAISNLVQNAIKFTSEGSVGIRVWAEGDEVLVEINDTGIGIPIDAQERLFQKFYRVQRPETRGIQGTGLGLAIAKSIVESYGGRIELESYPRLGSTFRVALPAYKDKPPDVSRRQDAGGS